MISIFLLVGQVAAPPAPSACLGMESVPAGTSWTYAGTRVWTAEGASQPDSGSVQWTSTVLAVRAVPSGHLLLVRGFVSELAWSVPTTQPRLSILACLGDRLVRVAFIADSAAQDVFQHWTDSHAERGEILLQPPLVDGAIFGQDPPRQDAMYGWVVERVRPPPAVPSTCGSPVPDAFRLTMRTLPDHEIVEWRAGLGVTAYTYAHHGTPAEVEVRLVRCSSR